MGLEATKVRVFTLAISIIKQARAPKNRPLHLHAVEPGNLADSYWRSVRIVLIDCQSKRRDVCTAAQRGRGDTVVSWKFFTGRVSPNENLIQLLLYPLYTPINHLRHGIYLQRHNPLLLMRYNSIYTVQHLHAAKPYFVGGRPEPLKSIYPLFPLHLNPPSKF